MYDDPIVAETRRLRDEYARRFHYDLDAICRDLQEQQARSDRTVVKRSPKRPVHENSERTTVLGGDRPESTEPRPSGSGPA